MSPAQNPILVGLSSLRLPLRREDLHAAALDALGQTLAFIDDTPQGAALAPQLSNLLRHHLASPVPPPAPPLSGFSCIGHPAARQVGAEALRDSVLLALQTGQADIGQSLIALVGLARAALPDAAAAGMIVQIEAARRRHARLGDTTPPSSRIH
jgi:hypothetical protein